MSMKAGPGGDRPAMNRRASLPSVLPSEHRVPAPPAAAEVEAEPSAQQIKQGLAEVATRSSPWAKLKQAADAGTAAISITDEDDGLRDLMSAMADAMSVATKEMMTSAKVPVAAFGRVKDITDKLKAQLGEMTAETWNAERSKTLALAKEQLAAQKADMEADFDEKLNAALAAVQAERDTQVEKAQAAMKATKKEYDELFSRSSSSEDLLKKGERAVAEAKDKAEKVAQEAARKDVAQKAQAELWMNTVNEVLNDCSLKARKADEKKEDNSRMWRAKQRSAAEQLRSEIDKHSKAPEEQLRAIVKAYEEAIHTGQEGADDERQANIKALAKAQKAQAEAEDKRKSDLEELKEQVEEAKALLVEEEAKTAELNKQMASIHKVARDEAREQSRVLEQDLMEKASKVQEAFDEKDSALTKLQELHATTQSQFQSYVESSGQLLQAQQSRLSAVMAALKLAQSAGKNGGYYFAAAPTKPGRGALAAMLEQQQLEEGGSMVDSPLGSPTDMRRSPGRSPLSSPGYFSRSSAVSRATMAHKSSSLSPVRAHVGSIASLPGANVKWPITTPWEEDPTRTDAAIPEVPTADEPLVDSKRASPQPPGPDAPPAPASPRPTREDLEPPRNLTPSGVRRNRPTLKRAPSTDSQQQDPSPVPVSAVAGIQDEAESPGNSGTPNGGRRGRPGSKRKAASGRKPARQNQLGQNNP